MVLSSYELEILEYLKSWKGTSVSMVEICRCAGGRKRFREDPNWAKGLMARLVDMNLAQVNDRGHYRVEPEDGEQSAETPKPVAMAAPKISEEPPPLKRAPKIVGEDYFPAVSEHEIKVERWLSPHFEALLRRAGKAPAKAPGKAH